MEEKSLLAKWHKLVLAKAPSGTTLESLWGDAFKSSTGWVQRIETEPRYPRWQQHAPAAITTSLWNSFLPHSPYAVIPLNTHPMLYDKVRYTPLQWQYLHITHITSNLTHAAAFVYSNMSRDDVNILLLMTHLKHSVQWPKTSTNVNDALSVSWHHLAEGEAHYSARIQGLCFFSLCACLQYHYSSWLAVLITVTGMWW